ncbi:DJ-1/PfpI family protein [Evansella tamaricis]|uniref:DJ-1/PfpI family protein n=1 Tax=Evansella tamaricis TaxID=2069301 RepID=A0ABS6JM33_9BACI|nr:DJ-1/PfpI family protein [Evansella tamaricis]
MKRICLLLPNGFEEVEASVFTDVFGWNLLEGDGTTKLVTVGTREQVKGTWNFTVIPEMVISEVNTDEFDALTVPGGFEHADYYKDAYREDVLTLIREFHEKGKFIASICVGALPLGKSGILKGRNGTTYNLSSGHRQNQLRSFGVNVLPDQPVVMDGNIITSHNPSTAFDVAFKLLELLTSKENCNHVKKLMGFK